MILNMECLPKKRKKQNEFDKLLSKFYNNTVNSFVSHGTKVNEFFLKKILFIKKQVFNAIIHKMI